MLATAVAMVTSVCGCSKDPLSTVYSTRRPASIDLVGTYVPDPASITTALAQTGMRSAAVINLQMDGRIFITGMNELGLKELGAVQDKVAGLRRFGAAALDMAYVAAGRLDGYWEQNVSPWDVAAGVVLVREAGGFATDIDGGDEMFTKRNILVGNEIVHRELQRLLKAAGKT